MTIVQSTQLTHAINRNVWLLADSVAFSTSSLPWLSLNSKCQTAAHAPVNWTNWWSSLFLRFKICDIVAMCLRRREDLRISGFSASQQVEKCLSTSWPRVCDNDHLPSGNTNVLLSCIPACWRYSALTRICAAEMAVLYAALSACRKVHPWR